MPVVAVGLAAVGLGGRRAGVNGRLVGVGVSIVRRVSVVGGISVVSGVGLRGVVRGVRLSRALAVPVVAVGLTPNGLGGRRAGVDGGGLVGLLGVVVGRLGGSGVVSGTGPLTVPGPESVCLSCSM